MQINSQQLQQQLKKTLAPIYLLSGDEPLLAQEAQEQIKVAAKKKGYDMRDLVTINPQFSISTLHQLTESGSLFSDKKHIDVRLQSAKIDKSLTQWLSEYAARPNPDILLTVTTPKLTAAQKKSKWLKGITETGVAVTIWPIKTGELPRWIQNRLKQLNLSAERSAIELLAHFTEGNLLATHQALTKLSLLFPNERITPEKAKQVISDNARFNVFDCSQYALMGQMAKSQRILQQLKQSGGEPTLILWSLAREVRLLHDIVYLKNNGQSYRSLINAQWKSRQTLVEKAAARCQLKNLEHLLKLCQRTDHSIKGLSQEDTWLLLSKIICLLSQ
jgi:DNA polymerase III subunit delta